MKFKRGDIVEWHTKGLTVVLIEGCDKGRYIDRSRYIYRFLICESNRPAENTKYSYFIEEIDQIGRKITGAKLKRYKLEAL